MKPLLTIASLKTEAVAFATKESGHGEASLFGITDGKAVGTYLEHKFQKALKEDYDYVRGSSAKGIDFPNLDVDIKVTSEQQPQSSCPFKSARQKVFGLGYSLLIFVYEKRDDADIQMAFLKINHVIFIDASRTADYQTTAGLRRILDNGGNSDDIVAFLSERFLPLDEIGALELAEEILKTRPQIGCLTISNALQWRLQYKRAIEEAGTIPGVERLA